MTEHHATPVEAHTEREDEVTLSFGIFKCITISVKNHLQRSVFCLKSKIKQASYGIVMYIDRRKEKTEVLDQRIN